MMTTATIDAERALTPEGFEEAQRAVLEKQISVYPARAFYPSTIAHPCSRHLVWRFTKWESQQPHGHVLQSIFNQGREQQPEIYRTLEAVGFQIVKESDRPVQYKVKNAAISGRPDGRVVAFRGTKYKPALVLEAKTMSGYQWDKIHTAEDVQRSASHWTRGYWAQGQLYAFLENLERGIFALRSKATGLVKVLPFELDYAFAEGLLKRVEELQPYIEHGADPEPIPYDANICGGCPFLGICYPPRSFGEGASIIDDPALVEDLERREQLRAAAKEYEEVDKAVKARFKHEGTKQAIVGPFLVEGSERNVRSYTVPARVDTIFDIRRLG